MVRSGAPRASSALRWPHPPLRREGRACLGAADGGGKASGRPRSGLDTIIAAIAVANDCVVVTDNERDFIGMGRQPDPGGALMRAKPFSRPTLIAAVELLEGHSQAASIRWSLRLGLEDEIGSGTAVSVAKKCDILGRVVFSVWTRSSTRSTAP